MPRRKRGESYASPLNACEDVAPEATSPGGPKALAIDAVKRQQRYSIQGAGIAIHQVEHFGPKKPRIATVSQGRAAYVNSNPARNIAKAIRDALRPELAPKPVKSFKDMTPEEQAEMRRTYEKK